jgi:hypothetical protein
MARGRARAVDIRHGDMVHRTIEDPFPQDHHWIIDLQQVGVGRPQTHGAQDEAVVQPVAREGQGVELVFTRRTGLFYGNAKIVLRCGRNDARR